MSTVDENKRTLKTPVAHSSAVEEQLFAVSDNFRTLKLSDFPDIETQERTVVLDELTLSFEDEMGTAAESLHRTLTALEGAIENTEALADDQNTENNDASATSSVIFDGESETDNWSPVTFSQRASSISTMSRSDSICEHSDADTEETFRNSQIIDLDDDEDFEDYEPPLESPHSFAVELPPSISPSPVEGQPARSPADLDSTSNTVRLSSRHLRSGSLRALQQSASLRSLHRRNSSKSSASKKDVKLQDVLLWEALDDPPVDKYSRIAHPSSVVVGKKMYIVGKNEHADVTEMYQYGFDDGRLTRIEMEESGLYPVADGERIFLFDVPVRWGSDYRYDVIEYHTVTGSWRKLRTTGIPPKSREGGFSTIYYDSAIYLFGGQQIFHGDVTGSFVYRLDLKSYEWTSLSYQGKFPSPQPHKPFLGCRSGQSAVLHNHCIYVFGGTVLESTGSSTMYHQRTTNDLHLFDLSTATWSQVQYTGTPPPPRTGHVARVLGPCMYVYGGKQSRGSAASNEVYRFDIATSRWSKLHPGWFAPVPREFASVTANIYDGALYAYGMMQAAENLLYRLRLEFVQAINDEDVPSDLAPTDILNDSETSDITFVVEGHEVFSHKLILTKFSKVFVSLLNTANPEDRIELPDISYDTFLLMLDHLYSGFRRRVSPSRALELLHVAERFQLSQLKAQCEEAIPISKSNVVHLIEVTENMDTTNLKRRCMDFLWAHFDAISSSGGFSNISRDFLLRLLKGNACKHQNVFEIEGAVSDNAIWKFTDGTTGQGSIPTIEGIGGGDLISLRICLDCKKLLGFVPQDVVALRAHSNSMM